MTLGLRLLLAKFTNTNGAAYVAAAVACTPRPNLRSRIAGVVLIKLLVVLSALIVSRSRF